MAKHLQKGETLISVYWTYETVADCTVYIYVSSYCYFCPFQMVKWCQFRYRTSSNSGAGSIFRGSTLQGTPCHMQLPSMALPAWATLSPVMGRAGCFFRQWYCCCWKMPSPLPVNQHNTSHYGFIIQELSHIATEH